MPFGRFGHVGHVGHAEFGTYFIGRSGTPSITEQMLQDMFLGNPPGNYDRILDFSNAVTGCPFFVPSADFFDDPPELAARSAEPDATRTGPTTRRDQ